MPGHQRARNWSVSGDLLDYLPSLYAAHSIRFFSVFVSYADKDEPAPSQLYGDLERAGVPVWKFNHDALPGSDTEDVIDRQIAARDKVVLICSRNSLDRPWVLQEVERARVKERDLRGRIYERRKTDPSFDVDWRVLFPVMLDDYALHGWRPIDAHIGELVRSRNIADLRYPPGSVGWQAEVSKIVRALDPKSRQMETLAPSARPALEVIERSRKS